MYVKGDNVVIGLDCDMSLSVVDKFLEKIFCYEISQCHFRSSVDLLVSQRRIKTSSRLLSVRFSFRSEHFSVKT